MNRVFREEKKFLLSQAEALAVGHRLEQIMLKKPRPFQSAASRSYGAFPRRHLALRPRLSTGLPFTFLHRIYTVFDKK